MPREVGTKAITFTPAEIDQLGLTFEKNLAEAVKARLAPSDAADQKILNALPRDVREFAQARAEGVGQSIEAVVIELLRSVMVAAYSAPKAA